MSGLDSEQLDELEERVAALLGSPWDSGTCRPKELTLREAIIVSSGYTRQNIIEDVWAEIFDTSQPTISRIITRITPLIEKATAEFRPDAECAKAAARGQTVLVDGFLAPCWSWRGAPGLWSGSIRQQASTARSYPISRATSYSSLSPSPATITT